MYGVMFEAVSAPVGPGGSVVLTAVVGASSPGNVVAMEIDNTQASLAATIGFKIQLQDHPNGEWYDYLADADWDANNNANVLFASAPGRTSCRSPSGPTSTSG